MLPSPTTKTSGIVILLLLANMAGLVAQQPASKEESLEREIAANWNSFQIQTKDLSPDARIAAVDQWQKSQCPKMEALKQAKFQAARQQVASPDRSALPIPVTNLDSINAAIENTLHPIRDTKLIPEERIRQIDAAMMKISTLQEQRASILRATDGPTSAATPLISGPVHYDQTTPEGRLAVMSREMMEQTKSMPPEERIAAVDARKDAIIALMREVQAAKAAAAKTTLTK